MRSLLAGSCSRIGAALAVVLGLALSMPGFAQSPSPAPICWPNVTMDTSMFSPATGQTELIVEVTWLVMGICVAIFVIVEGLLLFAVLRYRRRGSDEGDPAQCYGSGPIELAWTVVPIIIVLVLTLVTARAIFDIDRKQPPPNSMPVTVVGHQWWWEFRYPGLDIVTANELVLPVSDAARPRPIALTLTSADVVHSFWVPRLAGKMDVFPGRDNLMWFDPTEPGTFYGQCAEYCGNQHANMLIRVVVKEQSDWEQWVRDQKMPGAQDTSVAQGRKTFLSLSCINCHAVSGTEARGTFGPDLTHLMSRETLAAGVTMNTRDALRAWLIDPQHVKPGCNMPAMKLDEVELDRVLDYLVSLK